VNPTTPPSAARGAGRPANSGSATASEAGGTVVAAPAAEAGIIIAIVVDDLATVETVIGTVTAETGIVSETVETVTAVTEETEETGVLAIVIVIRDVTVIAMPSRRLTKARRCGAAVDSGNRLRFPSPLVPRKS
jgi:hypothetical protein